MQTENLISIVIPAYNVSKYLRQCLSSILHQSAKNYQIIIVNDGSTDDTGKICEEYQKNNSIKYIYQENKGLGAARNTGLTYVNTPYVCFLDSDDWQDIRFVEKFEQLITSLDFEPDIIFTLPKCYNEASHMLEYWMDKSEYEQIFEVQDNKSIKVINTDNCPEVYSLEVNANRKISRTGFLKDNHFTFPEGVKWEDIRPHIQLLHRAENVVALPGTGFIYRTNVPGQITAGTGAGRLDVIKVFHDVLDEVDRSDYSRAETAQIVNLMCKYSFWMLDMTNTEYIHALLEGLHQVFLRLSQEQISAFLDYKWKDAQEKNKKEAFMEFIRSDRYAQLALYEERNNMYRYWLLHGARKGNILTRGIQCIKDSGLKYTLKLMMKKMIGHGN